MSTPTNKETLLALLQHHNDSIALIESMLSDTKRTNLRSSSAIDGRHIANATTDARETTVLRLFKGEEVDPDYVNNILPCGVLKMTPLINKMLHTYPSLSETIEWVGGFKSKDFKFKHPETSKNIEFKSTKTKLSKAALSNLEKKPWGPYCEFRQGQLKNKESQSFLGPYKEEIIITQYFDQVIKDFVIKHNIEGPIDLESYKNAIYPYAEAQVKMLADTRIALGARNLIKYLKENKAAKTELANLWKTFSNNYMISHRLNDDELEAVIKKNLAQKHIWICISKDSAEVIEGPQCVSITFKKVKSGKTTSVLEYELELKKPSEKHSYKVPMEFRLHWKHGGQGVRNPNYMLS